MIFSTSKKTDVRADVRTVTAKDIGTLAPFRQLSDSIINSIAKNTRIVRLEAGVWSPQQDAEDTLYFLSEGELYFSSPGLKASRLRYYEPNTRFPLPKTKGVEISTREAATLLAIPARYLELEHSMHPEEHEHESASRHVHVDDALGNIYLNFLRTLKNGEYELPSLPDLAVRIGKAIDDPNTNSEDISRLIQLDPALTARIMSVVNSAAYGTTSQIQSVQQAVTRLGRHQVRSLVFSCIIKGLFRTDYPLLKKRMTSLWHHSCHVAAISFILAKYTPGLDPNKAMLAGLVHNIGTLPILHTARDNAAVGEDTELLNRIIDDLKAEIGGLTLKAWNFDPDMVELAEHAEQWHRLGTAIPDYLDVVLIAQLHAFIGKVKPGTYPPIDELPAFQKLALGQLTPRHSIGVLDHATKEIQEVEQLLR